jgi:hypothetical protein
MDGYTLLVMDGCADVHVTDEINTLPPSNAKSASEVSTGKSNHITTTSAPCSDLVAKLSEFFHMRGAPFTVANVATYIDAINDPAQDTLKRMYKDTYVILVRPDLYVSWFLSKSSVKQIR